MGVYKDTKRGTWYASVHYRDWQGQKRTKTRRGFRTKADAQEYEDSFRREESSTLDMKFREFAEVYERDVRPTIRENTWNTKEHVIRTKIIPYFGELRMNAIQPRDIRQWQNEIKKLVNENGEPYSETYLKTIQGQLSAIFNHAVRFYSLAKNPCHAAGFMGSSIPEKEMKFWTKEEYLKFIPCVADKPMSYYAFELLYWCGIREGELLALTPADFDFKNSMLHITKSLQRIHGKPIVTKPKTRKSIRTIKMPKMVNLEMQDYINCFYGAKPDTRIFPISKGYLHHEMDRGAKAAGVKRIRVHDLRHSHVSLLINMGYSALAIGNRVGHESERITYRYAHLFPSVQNEMAVDLDQEWKEGYGVGKKLRPQGENPEQDRRLPGFRGGDEAAERQGEAVGGKDQAGLSDRKHAPSEAGGESNSDHVVSVQKRSAVYPVAAERFEGYRRGIG